jgi:uncharacterized ion transporter superfamily protein YfcC
MAMAKETAVGFIYGSRYTDKVKKDPTKSLVYDKKEENEKQFLRSSGAEGMPEFDTRRKIIIILAGSTFKYGGKKWLSIYAIATLSNC